MLIGQNTLQQYLANIFNITYVNITIIVNKIICAHPTNGRYKQNISTYITCHVLPQITYGDMEINLLNQIGKFDRSISYNNAKYAIFYFLSLEYQIFQLDRCD